MLSRKTAIAAALAIAASAISSSCIEEKSDSEKFQVVVQGYVIQDYAADSSQVFKPYITVSSNLYSQPLKSVTVSGLNTMFKMKKATDFIFETDPDYEKTANLSRLNGTYTVTATSTNDLVATSSITISIADKDTLARLKTKSIDYDGNNINVKVLKAGNATAYGVSILPFDMKDVPQRINSYYKVAKYPAITKVDNDTVVSFSISFLQSQLGNDSAIIRPYISGASGLFQESDSVLRVAKK